MRATRAVFFALAAPVLAAAAVQAYSVAPVKASWSGMAHPVSGVSQLVTCCFDSLAYVELFAGDRGNPD